MRYVREIEEGGAVDMREAFLLLFIQIRRILKDYMRMPENRLFEYVYLPVYPCSVACGSNTLQRYCGRFSLGKVSTFYRL